MIQRGHILNNAGKTMNFIPSKAVAVTPHDTDTFAEGLLFVGVTGDIKVRPTGQADYVTFKNIEGGSFFPLYIIGVHTDTAATDMLICY